MRLNTRAGCILEGLALARTSIDAKKKDGKEVQWRWESNTYKLQPEEAEALWAQDMMQGVMASATATTMARVAKMRRGPTSIVYVLVGSWEVVGGN